MKKEIHSLQFVTYHLLIDNYNIILLYIIYCSIILYYSIIYSIKLYYSIIYNYHII